MTKVQAVRLLTLAWFLRTKVPRKRFEMCSYAEVGVRLLNVGSVGHMEVFEKKPANCGTSACALGWATAVFPSKFALLEDVDGRNFNITVDVRTKKAAEYDGHIVAKFFGLDEYECSFAFGPTERTPKQEAKILENLAKKHGWVYAGRTNYRKTKKSITK